MQMIIHEALISRNNSNSVCKHDEPRPRNACFARDLDLGQASVQLLGPHISQVQFRSLPALLLFGYSGLINVSIDVSSFIQLFLWLLGPTFIHVCKPFYIIVFRLTLLDPICEANISSLFHSRLCVSDRFRITQC